MASDIQQKSAIPATARCFAAEGHEWRFVEVEPLYFHQVDGSLAMVFREDDRGHITRMYTDFMPWYATVKLEWYETSGFNMTLELWAASWYSCP